MKTWSQRLDDFFKARLFGACSHRILTFLLLDDAVRSFVML